MLYYLTSCFSSFSFFQIPEGALAALEAAAAVFASVVG
jgi:hypothetical protein